MRIGLPEILVIVFVVLLLFGAKRIPELFLSLGKSLNEFKKGMAEGETDSASYSISGNTLTIADEQGTFTLNRQ